MRLRCLHSRLCSTPSATFVFAAANLSLSLRTSGRVLVVCCYLHETSLRTLRVTLTSAAELYRSIYNHVLSRDAVAELTIEDPSEAFEELRDKNDLRMLFSHQEFQHEALGGSLEKGKLGPPSDKLWVENWRRRLKLATVRPSPDPHRLLFSGWTLCSDNLKGWWRCSS